MAVERGKQMSVLVKCPVCHTKQRVSNRECVQCSQDLIKAKTTKPKNLIYYVSYRVLKKQHQQRVGTSLSEAKILDAKRKVQKDENHTAELLPQNMTFDRLAQWYFDLRVIKKLAMYVVAKAHSQRFNHCFGDKPIKTLKPVDLENFQIEKKDEGLSDSYIDAIVTTAMRMVKKAADNDLLSDNNLKPFRRIKKLLKKNANARDRIISPEEFYSLIKHLSHQYKPIVAMAYYTGMRRGEILKLTWGRVDLKQSIISLDTAGVDRAKTTKTKMPRRVPICPELHHYLTKLPRKLHGRVFFNTHKAGLRSAMHRACKAAGLKHGRNVPGGFIFHDLRHTFNTNARKAGVDPSVIMQITGHTTMEMFLRYNTVDIEDGKVAIDKLSDYLNGKKKEKKYG